MLIDSIHDMFVTHAHTDHILGAVWMIRIIAQRASNGHYSGRFRVYGHDKVLMVLDRSGWNIGSFPAGAGRAFRCGRKPF